MKTPPWKMVSFGEMEAGSCFLYIDGFGKHVALALAPEGESVGWVDLWNENPKGPPGKIQSAKRPSDSWGLQLGHVSPDFQLKSLYPVALS